jgi:hypothetical protein
MVVATTPLKQPFLAPGGTSCDSLHFTQTFASCIPSLATIAFPSPSLLPKDLRTKEQPGCARANQTLVSASLAFQSCLPSVQAQVRPQPLKLHTQYPSPEAPNTREPRPHRDPVTIKDPSDRRGPRLSGNAAARLISKRRRRRLSSIKPGAP